MRRELLPDDDLEADEDLFDVEGDADVPFDALFDGVAEGFAVAEDPLEALFEGVAEGFAVADDPLDALFEGVVDGFAPDDDPLEL